MSKALHIFLLTIFIQSVGFSQEIQIYNGERIDLIDHSIWTLFKGKGKVLLAKNIKENDLCDYMQNEPGIWWFDSEVDIANRFIEENDLWLFVRSESSATNVYINGQLIFENGVVANSISEEKEGNYYKYKIIPSTFLKVGKNIITLKFSNYHHPNCLDISDVYLSPYEALETRLNRKLFFPSFLSGFFLLAFILNTILFFAYKKRIVFLLLSLFFLFYFFFLMSNALRAYAFNPKVTYHYWLVWIHYFSHVIGKFLLIGVLLFEFQFNRKVRIWILIGMIIYSLIEYFFSMDVMFRYLFAITYSLIIAIWAKFLNKEGALNIVLGLSVLLLFTWLNLDGQMNYGYMFGVMFFALVMIFSFIQKMVSQNQKYHESKLKSSTLENQLIQKHIQPHFLMNSLMSVQELIEVNTKEAIGMIEDLSKEFYLLNSINSQKLIPLTEEVEICRIHLKIMSAQQKSVFELKTIGLSGNEMVPPAIFHTLIENGLTHGYRGEQNGHFELRKEENDFMISYRLFNDGKSDSTRKEIKVDGFKIY